jgi:ABC-type transport system substrate-binding protein
MSDLEGNINPQLATSFEWSNNNKTVTFYLREGVKFHDGTDFNAQAVDWNVQRRINAGVGGADNIESTQIVDDYTYVINIKEYKNTFILQMAGEGSGAVLGIIMSPAAVEEHSEDWADTHPVGTGPFKFKEYKVDTYYEMERNDDYWGGKPLLDGIKWIFIKDTVSAELAFEAGEADVLFQIGQSTTILRDMTPKGYPVDKFAGLNLNLIPSSGNPNSPLSNPKVREAIEYAIDKEKICQSVLYGYAQPMYQLAIPFQFTYIPDFEGREYDPDKARQLLEEAGYGSGFDTTIYCQFTLAGDDTTAIQSYLKAVGINAKLDVIEIPKWIDMETNGWEDGLMVSPQGATGYAAFLQRYWVKPETPNWSSGLYWTTLQRTDEIEALIQDYYLKPTLEEQTTASHAIIQEMYDEAFAIPLWLLDDCFILQPYVRDLKAGDTTYGFRFDELGAWLDK